MKLFIASDLHGSAYYTAMMLEAYKKSGADRLVLLGDILYHGPRNDLPKDYSPKTVASLLNSHADKIISVRGNCEAEVDSLLLDFSVESNYCVIFDDINTLYLSHGHRDVPKMPSDHTYYLTGHTHIPHDYTENGIHFLNPGSVSIPKNNSPHSALIYENGNFSWLDIESENEYIPQKMR